ncbi:MAG: hypothetical protein ACT4OJ_01105 [Bacteroidota bacterium]
MKHPFSIFAALFLIFAHTATANPSKISGYDELLPDKKKIVLSKKTPNPKLNPCYVTVTKNPVSGSHYCASKNTLYTWTVQGTGTAHSQSNCAHAFIQAEAKANLDESENNDAERNSAIAACAS